MTRLLRAVLLLLTFAAGPVLAAKSAVPPQPPKLIVVISVDQFSADLMATYRGHFTGGMKTLLDGGIVYASGYQSHAATETCPGHATILTGRHPASTGIVANNWVDAATGIDVYCTDSPNTADPTAKPTPGFANLMAPTLGDWLKDASPQNRTFAVAGKDRAAIMMAGRKADGVFWFKDGLYKLTTIAGAPLTPLDAFNTALAAAWQKAPPKWQVADKSCATRGGSVAGMSANGTPGDGDMPAWTSMVPPDGWPLKDGLKAGLLRASPVWDQVVTDAALNLLVSQKLGQQTGTDVLAIGLSATDYIGHTYGAQGAEMCDQMAHLDGLVGKILGALKKQQVPFLVVLTADHGGLDVVERLNASGYTEAGRPTAFQASKIFDGLNAAMMQKFTLAAAPFTSIGASKGAPDVEQLTLLPGVAKDVRTDVLRAAQSWLRENSSVAEVFMTAELVGKKPPAGLPPTEWSLAERVAVNVYAGRVGDLYLVFPPNRSAAFAPGYRAGHGSPYDYDRRVPIVFYGTSIPAQERPLPVDTVDIAPTLAHVLGFTPPTPVDGRCLTLAAFPSGACAAAK
jgi:predicted AlkP superfamily pyrophosphatase or phosphodiesterase